MADTVRYRAHVTDLGKAKLMEAVAKGGMLKITHMVAGDGGGTTPEPTADIDALVGEQVWSGEVSNVLTAEDDPYILMVEAFISGTDGGFFVREIGCLDADGDLVIWTPAPETYKPVPTEGASKDFALSVYVAVSDVDHIELVVSDSGATASKQDILELREELAEALSAVEDAASTSEQAQTTAEQAQATAQSKADPSTAVTFTLTAAGWTGDGPYTQAASVTGVTADGNAVVDTAMGSTEEQEDAYAAARIKPTAQAAGQITFAAIGDKPEIDIPMAALIVG